jgi:4-amino-4-deoxychorismate lyase
VVDLTNTLVCVTEQMVTTAADQQRNDSPSGAPQPGFAGRTPTMVVGLLDGRLVPSTVPLLRPDDAGVTRGDGVFETTLVHAGTPRDLEEHLARMAISARMTDLVLPDPMDWQRGIDAVLDSWSGGDMVLRLIATRGPEHGVPTCYVTGSAVSETAVRQRVTGVRVLLLDRGFSGPAAAAAPWLLAGAKTLSYAINMAALRYASAHDADDVIFIGSDGGVLEAPTATVVLLRGRTLLTPPLEGVLDGITVVRLFRAAQDAGWSTAYRALTRDDLLGADGVFLASSIRLLTQVTSIDGSPRGDSGRSSELQGLLDCP